jgi:hypothetical protein
VETGKTDFLYIRGLPNSSTSTSLDRALVSLKKVLQKYGMDEEESTSLLNTYKSEILESMRITEEDLDFDILKKLIEKLNYRVEEEIREIITSSENKMSEIMLTHCLGMQDSQYLILMNHSKLSAQEYFTDGEMPSLMQPFLPSYMDVKSKNETERKSMRKEANSIKSLINIQFEKELQGQKDREYAMRHETLGQREKREKMEWYTRGNDKLKKKSEKDKQSWEILRTQPWLYGKKDESFSEQELVRGI